MPFENRVLTFSEWFLGSDTFSMFNPATWDQIGFMVGTMVMLLLMAILAPFIWYLMAVVKHGPSEAFYVVATAIAGALVDDLPRFSIRRTFAIVRLAIQEAIRNKILIGFSVFLVVLLFAGLFLDITTSDNPARVYLNFVLSMTNFLVLMMALFLSVFSIPNDIENRTIYTVVTKPVRAGEIVLGRVIGFTAVGTAMLLCMGIVSYIFVVRGLSHTHTLSMADVKVEANAKGGKDAATRRKGESSFVQNHSHAVYVTEQDGKVVAITDTQHGHRHSVKVVGEGPDAKVVFGPAEGDLIARSPQFGSLLVLDRDGNAPKQGERGGTNVGAEWNYRGYIEGGKTKSVAIWTFSNVTRDRFPQGVPLELNLSVFRTYKGDIERGVLGELVLRNPKTGKMSPPRIFESQEFVSQRLDVPTEWTTPPGADGKRGKIDLFEDLVDDGVVEVRIRCAEGAQFFGVALADVYIRGRDKSFALNFFKGYLSIWIQMLLVTCFGVTFSTFLKGPVAMLATMSAIVMGFFVDVIRSVSTGTLEGGGPVESLIRLLTQQNVMTDLEVSSGIVRVVKSIDMLVMATMHAITFVLPNYRSFDTSAFVSSGYDVYGALVAQHCLMAVLYFVSVTLVGYFFLKTREIAG